MILMQDSQDENQWQVATNSNFKISEKQKTLNEIKKKINVF